MDPLLSNLDYFFLFAVQANLEMNTPNQTRRCPDCEGSLHEIRIVAASQPSMFGEGSAHRDLGYASPDAESSPIFGRVPLLGKISGLVCDGCKRVFFYASGVVPEVIAEEQKSNPDNW